MTIYIILGVSLLIHILVGWYLVSVLKKLLYVSENIADLYLLLKSFHVFVKSLYSMTSYNGEPIIKELVLRVQTILEEIESFRDVFAPTLDEELEEELNAEEDPEETN